MSGANSPSAYEESMERKMKLGGPAFPTTKPLDGWGDPNQGMSLRDYFAGQALQAMIENTACSVYSSEYEIENVALVAYRIADAMIKERKKNA